MKKTLLIGATFGAAAMYLLDPENGATRRAAAEGAVRKALASPAGQQAVGTVAEATRPLRDHGPDSDPTLANKVRSEVLGRAEFTDLSVNVSAADGLVTLHGQITDAETRDALTSAVRGIGGVKEVDLRVD